MSEDLQATDPEDVKIIKLARAMTGEARAAITVPTRELGS